jgi:hypothetical protein
MNFIEQPLELDHSIQKTQPLLKLNVGCGFGFPCRQITASQ